MGRVVDVPHVADRKTLAGLLAKAAPCRIQLWRFAERSASLVEDRESVDEDLVETWWTAAVSASLTAEGGYFVVLLVRDGRPWRWLLLAPRRERTPVLEQAARERDRAVLRMAAAGMAEGLRQRRKRGT
jgi:hypothetical protein